MATGPVNSQSNPAADAAKKRLEELQKANEAAALAALGTLRSGETQTTTQEALADPDAKTYMHMVKGARFIMPNGLEIRFLGGFFRTNDPVIIAELDKVANKSTSQIYTKSEAKEAAGELQRLAAEDASHDQAPKK